MQMITDAYVNMLNTTAQETVHQVCYVDPLRGCLHKPKTWMKRVGRVNMVLQSIPAETEATTQGTEAEKSKAQRIAKDKKEAQTEAGQEVHEEASRSACE